jgi:hypothetical protein
VYLELIDQVKHMKNLGNDERNIETSAKAALRRLEQGKQTEIIADALAEHRLDSICILEGLYTFRDPLGELYAFVPDDPVEKVWNLRICRHRVEAWLSERYFATTGELLNTATMRGFFKVLEGKAFLRCQSIPDDTALASHVQNDPFVAMVVRFIEGRKEDWTGRTEVLLKEVEDFAAKEGFWTRSPKWPTITKSVTQRLRKYTAVLLQLGVRYMHDKKSTGSFTYLQWSSIANQPDANDATSQITTPPDSATSSTQLNNNRANDAADATDATSERASALDAVNKLARKLKGELE